MPELDSTQAHATQEPAAAAPGDSRPTDAKKSLEELLADLDDDRRGVILGEVSKARNEAKNLRTRLTEAEPKIAEYDRLAQASQTDAERALAAQQAAEARAEAAVQRIAKAEVKAALAGLVDDPDSIIEDLNLSRFVDSNGDIDAGALSALKSKYAAFAGRRAPRPDHTQASGSNGATASTPAAELAAILQGQLNRQ